MNGKIVRQTILLSAAVFLLLLLVIAVSNKDELQRRFGEKTEDVQPVSTEDAANGEGQIGNDLSAFLRDSSFFEPKKNPSGITVTHGRKVSMIASSIAQDLRIMILDQVGALCTGTPFRVTVEGQGQYTDTDEDGIIYLEHLRAGSYFVSLAQQDGYVVDNTKLEIEVKQKLEYVVLEDISYLVLTEEQVDAETDDTGKNDAGEEADGTERTGAEDFVSLGAVGVDVSRYNQEIDWEKVADDGIEFAVIRCGYRGASSGSLVEDPLFEQNMEGALGAGLKVGVYFFSQAVTEKEAVEEASMVAELCKYYHLELPVYLDSESAGGAGRADGLEAEERTDIVKAFCKTIENAGYNAGVYASKNWFDKKLISSELEQYSIWMAQYTDSPDYGGSYQIWQYTSKGDVDGISTKVDLNVRYN